MRSSADQHVWWTARLRSSANRDTRLHLCTAGCRFHEHLGRRFPVVVVSDALAAQFGAHADAGGSTQVAGQPAGAVQRAAEGEEDAELEALLQQMDVGSGTGGCGSRGSGAAGGWGVGHPAAPSAAAADDSGIAGLLDSLGISDEPRSEAQPATAIVQQAQQHPTPPAAAASYPPVDLEPGLHILSTAAYWGGVWGHVPAVADVFDSLQQSKAEEARQGSGGSGGGGFRPHLSHAAMEAGLASGDLLAGTLCASRRVPGEATVAVGGGRQLLISGRPALNRAIHGDRVAVRLLPREQWRPAAELAAPAASAGSTPAGAAAEEEGEADEHDLLAATGDGEAAVAADGAADAADGEDEPLDAVVGAGVMSRRVCAVISHW